MSAASTPGSPARPRRQAGAAPLLVAIDVGTSGARAVAVDLEGNVVTEVRRPYPTHIPRPGWAEQDPRDWEAAAVEALAGQCPTIAAFDGRGRPVGQGMLYRDNRAVAEAAAMRERIGVQELHRRTGHVAEAFHAGPKILWLRTHDRQAFAATRCFLQPRDVVLRRLTGRGADHHWPFTRQRNATGRIEADQALAALDASEASGTALILEVIPPFEQDDDEVVAELEESVAYWRAALTRRR